MDELNIDVEKAILFLLQEKYYSEFKVINRHNQHPDGLNYYDWLFKHSLITKEKLKEINIEIENEEDY